MTSSAPKPPQKKPRKKRGRPPATADRREEILDAALECFVTRGFHGTAVPQVSKQAGIAAGTIYHYFPGKEALVNALFQKWKGAIASHVFAGFPALATVREQFRVMWSEMVTFALANPRAFAFLELHHHVSYLDEDSRAMEHRLKEFAGSIVAAAQADGLIKPGPPTLIMELVFGAFNGMMRASYEGRIDLTDADIALAERACWDAIAVHPEADGTGLR